VFELQIVHPYGDMHHDTYKNQTIPCMVYIKTATQILHIGYMQVKESEWDEFKRGMEAKGTYFAPGWS
jgi:hypothetical protein